MNEQLSAHLETWRPMVSLNAGITSVAGAAVAQHGLHSAGRTAVIFLATVSGYLASLYGTDFKDRAEDARTRPHRPIPSGRLSEDNAVIIMSLCMGAGLLGASWLGFQAVLVSCIALVIAVIRATTKGWGLIAPVTRSLATGVNLLFGAVAAVPGGTLTGLRSAAWITAALFVVETFPKSLLGGLWDVEADRATGVRTCWVRYGYQPMRRLVLAGLAASMVFSVALPAVVSVRAAPYYLLLVPFLVCTALGGRDLRPERDTRAGLSALIWLFRERALLVGAIVAGTAGLPIALAVSVPVIVVGEWHRRVLMAPRMYRLDPDMVADGG
ncbi:MAG: geranylgeranylglycerol-phosphate geranylgeranyltransferase [Mycobacteriales bacterium]|jgi:geranylgeranylglycerol-phosphate geranylgeranyltransferase